MKSPDLILFARQPVLERVKTRLQVHYSAKQVVEIAKFLVRATVKLAVANWPSEVYLYATPDAEHAFFRALAEEFRIHLASQARGNLGHKMLCALREGIARRGVAGVMGCDVPHCRPDIIEHAHEQLAKGYNIIGPTEDGGYYFIGMQQVQNALFESMQWGGRDVAEVTLARAQQLGLRFELLPKLTDIDTPEDLWVVAQEYEPLRKHLYSVLAGQFVADS